VIHAVNKLGSFFGMSDFHYLRWRLTPTYPLY
jgi:hypothetical protein